MKISIITQNEPFYLSKNIQYLINNIPNEIEIDSCFILKHNPTVGAKKNRIIQIISVFGLSFFMHYLFRFFVSKIKNKSVEQICRINGIEIIKVKGNINDKKHIEIIKKKKLDILVSILGSQIFKKEIIKIPRHGIINLHSSILPKYRGVMPTFWVLKNNEKTTGVSVFFVDEGIDSGKIVAQEEITINEKNQELLIKKTKKIGMDLIINSLISIHSKKLILIENNDNKSTYFGFPTKSDVKQFKKAGAKFY